MMSQDERLRRLEEEVERLKPKRKAITAPKESAADKKKVKAAMEYAFERAREDGKVPAPKEIADAVGCGLRRTGEKVSFAVEEILKDREERGALLDPSHLPKTKREEFERIIRGHKRHLDEQFEFRVKAEIDKRLNAYILPHYNAEHEHHKAVVKARKGVFTRQEYRKILAALHPDNFPDGRSDRYAELFSLFSERELVLCAEKDVHTSSVTLPKTAAEMMARRAETMRKKK